MDETEIVDRWVNFLKPLLQRDIDVLLKLYLSDFNRKYNNDNCVEEYDLTQTFYDMMNYYYGCKFEIED
jgi:hypothetical protein